MCPEWKPPHVGDAGILGRLRAVLGALPDDCPRCGGWWSAGYQPNYEHIHHSETLPLGVRTDGRIIVRGYAARLAGLGGGIDQVWVFFEHLEPALVFGRAGRMSLSDITGYGVYWAAREIRWDPELRRDIRTLHVQLSHRLERSQDEPEVLRRWVRGCDPRSAQFHPPG